jgi:aspartyl-tRNA(Asn)/glutamyl-tRNA(Gln) amidotransferase subunit A
MPERECFEASVPDSGNERAVRSDTFTVVNLNIVGLRFHRFIPPPSFAAINQRITRRSLDRTEIMGRFDSIGDASRLLGSGKASSLEVCIELLSDIQSQDAAIGAFSDILEETALTEAIASDTRRAQGRLLGPLDGIPLAVKDIIDTRPAACKAGLDHLSDYRPPADAAVVKRLREAGAIILGVTETDPGAFSTGTLRVTNPLAPRRIAGGSSGGSGAAVAAGLAFAALGTDTGGSVRIPAACCSVHAFKPSWGRVDSTGVRPLAPSLDHVGVIARSVADLGIVQGVLDPRLSASRERALRGGFSLGTSEAYFADADDTVKQAMADTLERLRRSWVQFTDVSLPQPEDVLRFHMVNLPREAAAYHTERFPSHWPLYPDVARRTIEKGISISVAEYHAAEELRAKARSRVDAALEGVDAIILPTLPTDAPARDSDAIELGKRRFSQLEATIRYTALFNQSGHPVLSMPAALLPDGRAISVQLVGTRGGDAELLKLARRVERVLDVSVDYAAIIASRSAGAHAGQGVA